MSLARVVLRLGAPRASLSIASRGFVTSREAVERLVGTSLDTGEGAIDSAFLALDKNSDGVIQPDELAAGLKTRVGLELSDDKVEKLVARYSKRGDNVINLEEYAALLDDALVALDIDRTPAAEAADFDRVGERLEALITDHVVRYVEDGEAVECALVHAFKQRKHTVITESVAA